MNQRVEDAATLASYSGRLAASYLSKQIQQQIESVADRIDRLDRDIRRRGSRLLGLNGMFEGLRRVRASDIPGLRSQASRNPFLDLRTRFLNVAGLWIVMCNEVSFRPCAELAQVIFEEVLLEVSSLHK